MSTARMPPESHPSSQDLFRRLERLLGPGQARFVLIESDYHPASTAVIVELMDRRGGAGRVVLHHPVPFRSPPGRVPRSSPPWKVVTASEVPGSVVATARSMCAANTLVAVGPNDVMLRALWLPPSLLEAYAELPPSTEAVLVVDDWYSLVEEYLGGTPSGNSLRPEARDLDPLLVEVFRELSDVHFLVGTSRSSPSLEAAADAILDVHAVGNDHGALEVRIFRDCLEPPPLEPYVLQLSPSGFLAVES